MYWTKLAKMKQYQTIEVYGFEIGTLDKSVLCVTPFINLSRVVKTKYIFQYLTGKDLRQTVQTQLNKGEYRYKLPRWISFANQGEFTTGDYEEIMNKASNISLVSNAIEYKSY